MSYLIQAAINDCNDFEAARLILIRTGRSTIQTAALDTWQLGPIEGQALIQEWLDQHPEALEDQAARATPILNQIIEEFDDMANGPDDTQTKQEPSA